MCRCQVICNRVLASAFMQVRGRNVCLVLGYTRWGYSESICNRLFWLILIVILMGRWSVGQAVSQAGGSGRAAACAFASRVRTSAPSTALLRCCAVACSRAAAWVSCCVLVWLGARAIQCPSPARKTCHLLLVTTHWASIELTAHLHNSLRSEETVLLLGFFARFGIGTDKYGRSAPGYFSVLIHCAPAVMAFKDLGPHLLHICANTGSSSMAAIFHVAILEHGHHAGCTHAAVSLALAPCPLLHVLCDGRRLV